VLCSKCGRVLREDAHFCMECGQPATATGPPAPARTIRAGPSRPRATIAAAGFLILVAVGFLLLSQSGGRRGLREKFVSPPHIETISQGTFSMEPRGLTSNKFAVPAGASNVVVAGQFDAGDGPGNEIEVYVLSDDAFVTWRDGYSTSTYYDSGKVSRGIIRATLPVDAGYYYLVFSNKVSPKTARTVQADVTLQYSRWAPDWFYRMKKEEF
jgi:hypothetical protein